MSDNIMERLVAVEPLPRGERLSRWSEAECCPPRKRTWNLLCRSSVLGVLHDALYEDPPSSRAWFWRHYAAPLRRCREERKQFRIEMNFWASSARVLMCEREEIYKAAPWLKGDG